MTLLLILTILFGTFAVITFILSFTKDSEGCSKVSAGLALAAIVCLSAYFYTASDEKTHTISSNSTITTTATETAPEITTVEIDGITYAVMDDKLYEIIKNKGETK